MTAERRRRLLFFGLALPLGALMLTAVAGLAPFGHYPGPYGDLIVARVLPERHMTNAVAAVTFDYRGFDTLGEEFILLSAVTGVVVLLRERRGGPGSHSIAYPIRGRTPPRAAALVLAGRPLFGAVTVYAVYLIAHACITPGGGFQGGLLLGAATLVLYLAGSYERYRALVRPVATETVEGLGAALFVLVGLLPLPAGLPYLTNLLPLGRQGEILSGGTVALANAAVGIEVAAGFALAFAEFLEETRQPLAGKEE